MKRNERPHGERMFGRLCAANRACRRPRMPLFLMAAILVVPSFSVTHSGEPVPKAAEQTNDPRRLLSLDSWFTFDAIPLHELIHNANVPDRPALNLSLGYPGLRSTVFDSWQSQTGVDLIEGKYTTEKVPEKLFKLGAKDRVTKFVQKKPDVVVLTVQMLGPVNKREKRDSLLVALKGYHDLCRQNGARTVALAVPEWFLGLEDHPQYRTAVSPEIEPMERLAAETDVQVAPVFLAFEYLRRQHPEIHTNPVFKGYDAEKAKGALYGCRHPGNGDNYVMAAVLFVTLTGRQIAESPDLDQVNAALKKSYHPDPNYTLTAEAQTVIHQVACEACEDFAKRVKALKESRTAGGDRPKNE